MNEVFIVSAKRTPIGGFLGSLSDFSATELGAIAIKSVLNTSGLDSQAVDAVYMGNVLSANLGQSPARQAAKLAGISDTADATTINKVCASGMKALMLAAQQIETGHNHVVVAGGMESMSNVPHYVKLRKAPKVGHDAFTDGLLKDGLTDAYHNIHMGAAAELVVKEFKISREQQDEYTLLSYNRAKNATKENLFAEELAPVEQKQNLLPLTVDEDINKLILEKVTRLKPIFDSHGTITAANASNLNDGAAAFILASKTAIDKHGLKPVARVIGFADAAQEPKWFTTSPSKVIPLALKRAGLLVKDIDYFEINEAYASVVLANQNILGLDIDRINVFGGAVAMGHPIGASGARIVSTLISVLKYNRARYGVASICNGGGGASAVVVENI
jgi:acetyl-CoA C-acetyltransferase